MGKEILKFGDFEIGKKNYRNKAPIFLKECRY